MKVMYSIKNNETIATIQPDQNDFIEEIKNIEKKCCNSKEFLFYLKSDIFGKCFTYDTFNLEKGKEIAYKRAYLKFLRDKAKKAEIVHKYLFDFFNREVDMYQHTLSSMNHIYDDLLKLTTD